MMTQKNGETELNSNFKDVKLIGEELDEENGIKVESTHTLSQQHQVNFIHP